MKEQEIIVNFVIIVILFLSIICIFSGCALRLYPIRNTDKQVELYRAGCIRSYKQGVTDAVQAYEEYEQQSTPDLLLFEFEEIPMDRPNESVPGRSM